MYFFKAGGHKPFLKRPARIAPHMMGGDSSVLLADEMFHIQMASVIVNASAIRFGAGYDIGSGQFTWKSRDGLCSGYNLDVVTGGRLVASGLGKGTPIRLVPNADPLPTNVYVRDEDI
jgi:hypothetical protein